MGIEVIIGSIVAVVAGLIAVFFKGQSYGASKEREVIAKAQAEHAEESRKAARKFAQELATRMKKAQAEELAKVREIQERVREETSGGVEGSAADAKARLDRARKAWDES